jgi:hypothetical protein
MRNASPVRSWPIASVALFALASGASAAPQCDARWEPGFEQIEVAPGVVASAVADFGGGSELYFGTGSPQQSVQILRWDGDQVTSIGSLTPDPFLGEAYLRDMIAFDDGTGVQIFVAGMFRGVGGATSANVARWNGTTWLSAQYGDGWDDGAYSFCVHDDGTGPALYVGGNLESAGDVARWNGSTWVAVGSIPPSYATAIQSYDDGTGARLYAAGPGLFRWNGTAWSQVAGVVGVQDMIAADLGAGPRLFLGGSFTNVGPVLCSRVAVYDGTTFNPLGAGLGGPVSTLQTFVEGGVVKLGAGGSFATADNLPAPNCAKWDGTAWHAVGGGTNGPVTALDLYDSGQGLELVAGGSFSMAGNVATSSLARWTSTRWSRLSDGEGANFEVRALCEHDDGAGRALFAGGAFTRVGGILANRVARWDGSEWSTLGSGLAGNSYPFGSALPTVRAMTPFDDGNGLGLFVGGDFATAGGAPARGIAVWRNGAWSAVGGGLAGNGTIDALCVHDDGSGPALYAGGLFTGIGTVTTKGIARWDGASWSAVGGGLTTYNSYDGAYALASWDDGVGGGPSLFVGGSYTDAGGVAGTRNLAAWNGTSWVALGGPYFGGANHFVRALLPFGDGTGAKLYVGGSFAILGGFYCKAIGSWNGSNFWPVGAGFPNTESGNTGAWTVSALGVFDEGAGQGQRLYATGAIETSNDTDYNGIARWGGSSWETLSSGFSGFATGRALQSFDDGSSAGPALYVGGQMSTAGGIASYNIARWRSTCPDPRAFCFGDGSGTACPCGNAGAAGNGCATSFNPNGGNLSAGGMPSVANDTVVLTGSGLSNSIVTFFQGTTRQSGGAGSVFGDGLRCAGGTTIRLGAKPTTGGTAQYPGPGDPTVSARGLIPAEGGTRTYQVWYRNAASFCTAATFNLTNGLEITFAP